MKPRKIWIIANTDRNQGPYVIELEQYIEDATVRLINASPCEVPPAEEAQAEGRNLFSGIWRWTVMAK